MTGLPPLDSRMGAGAGRALMLKAYKIRALLSRRKYAGPLFWTRGESAPAAVNFGGQTGTARYDYYSGS